MIGIPQAGGDVVERVATRQADGVGIEEGAGTRLRPEGQLPRLWTERPVADASTSHAALIGI